MTVGSANRTFIVFAAAFGYFGKSFLFGGRLGEMVGDLGRGSLVAPNVPHLFMNAQNVDVLYQHLAVPEQNSCPSTFPPQLAAGAAAMAVGKDDVESSAVAPSFPVAESLITNGTNLPASSVLVSPPSISKNDRPAPPAHYLSTLGEGIAFLRRVPPRRPGAQGLNCYIFYVFLNGKRTTLVCGCAYCMWTSDISTFPCYDLSSSRSKDPPSLSTARTPKHTPKPRGKMRTILLPPSCVRAGTGKYSLRRSTADPLHAV
jgi:hypothetical protein